ncbi:hypothetical protein L9F63_011735, partial [Diploptera punctata]
FKRGADTTREHCCFLDNNEHKILKSQLFVLISVMIFVSQDRGLSIWKEAGPGLYWKPALPIEKNISIILVPVSVPMEEKFLLQNIFTSVVTVDMQAVEGKSVELPCNVTPPGHDKVYMVFWFRDDAGIPLY